MFENARREGRRDGQGKLVEPYLHVETGAEPDMTNQGFRDWMANTRGFAEFDEEHFGKPQPYQDTGEERQGAPNTLTRAQIYRVRE